MTESFVPSIFHYKRRFFYQEKQHCRDEKAVSTLNISLCLFFMKKIFFFLFIVDILLQYIINFAED